ncbi:MAG TPA: ATP-binding protein [Chloroflexota bacterium]|nr:ATP-binding protein [Chloroflexota bacterium]
MLDDRQIVGQNAWWREDSAWQQRDPHLRRLATQPAKFPSQLVRKADLKASAIHVIRGPRQVGKSTDLKLLVPKALEEGRPARQIIYLSLDLLENQPGAEIERTVYRAKELASSSADAKAPALLLLDEVTSVERWQTAIKALWDDGVIDRDVVYCTGSSAADLAFGVVERLPGRRGRGLDHLVLPQPFSEFARALHPSMPPSPCLTVSELFSDAGREALHEIALHAADLEDAFTRYLRFGGFPAAVVEAMGGALEPSPFAQRVVLDSLLKEVGRRGISEPAMHALLERVALSLGSKTSWSAMAKEMDVPLGTRSGKTYDARSLRQYVEFLAAGYFIFIVYFWKQRTDSNAISKERKVYFGDPLLHEVAKTYAPGLREDLPSLVENAVGLALLRRYESSQALFEGFLTPGDLHVWESARGGELDFACGPRRALDLVEVKYQASIDRRLVSGYRRAFPERPVAVATRQTTDIGHNEALVPAHILTWMLA